MKTQEKLELLRKAMKKESVDAYIVYHSDPHISEYLPDHWKAREWLSGFTGSAGTLAVTQGHAALWTDSRYFIQAEQQLKGSGIELCKMGLPETPDIPSWLAINLNRQGLVATNGKVVSVSSAKQLKKALLNYGFDVSFKYDLISDIWEDRPKMPKQKAYMHSLEYAGISIQEKLGSIRKQLLASDATAYLMCALDEVCWTFNIRGTDIEYNPVVISYGYVDQDKAYLFIDSDKIDDNLSDLFRNEEVEVKGYKKLEKFLSKLGKNTVLLFDPSKTNLAVKKSISSKVKTIEQTGVVSIIKARKKPIEIEGIRKAMTQDGVALVKFFKWLYDNVGKIEITELDIAQKLRDFRGESEYFVGESFDTIAGYKDHGAIVHYSANEETSYSIKPDGFLLIDSGGQYLNGTTDITRTVHLGEPTEQEKVDYTLILKGMIQLSKAKFPASTRGSQLDTLARMALWSKGLNYGHGTGHGVGYFLNVHEGPQQIRPENHLPIEVGMVMSDEPGIYRAGQYGIRIENLIVCQEDETNDYGRFLSFSTLTLCPIDTKAINKDILLDEEKSWLNNYHKQVYEQLSPYLDKEHKEWLKEATKEI